MLDEVVGEQEAAEWIGHGVEVYRRWYRKNRRTLAKLEQKRRLADFLSARRRCRSGSARRGRS
jgi:hypothetical protein